MTAKDNNIEISQSTFCKSREIECSLTTPDSMLGFAIETQGQIPINGLRHPSVNGTSGWYVWCGETFSFKPDFFSPIHTRHLIRRCPEAVKCLGLPAGYRFLIAGDYIDIWYDAELLNI